ncbi:MAG: hypothetical protein QME68_01045 [Elusimicrobiota bacterium]|nr:hypothetical protein [Elusimicrobiota bacterium]
MKGIKLCALAIFSIGILIISTGQISPLQLQEKKTQEPVVKEQEILQPVPEPVYICELPNINEYEIFATTGWDGNWYVGYNVCWIEVLPPAPLGNYRKAFIGAKLGRAKTRQIEGRPTWEREPIPGDIYIAIASTSAWSAKDRYFLTSTEDIPLEGDPENALNNVGEARWFWCEVPTERINFDGPNFVALWSPTDTFTSRDTAPILCGGWGAKGAPTNTYLNDEIQGTPPIKPDTALKTPISVFEPAIAAKLIPEGTEQEIKVYITGIRPGKRETAQKTITVRIDGNEIYRTWLEVATATTTYKKVGRYLYNPPYVFTLNPELLPKGKIFLRVAAEDVWSNCGYSEPVELVVELKK